MSEPATTPKAAEKVRAIIKVAQLRGRAAVMEAHVDNTRLTPTTRKHCEKVLNKALDEIAKIEKECLR